MPNDLIHNKSLGFNALAVALNFLNTTESKMLLHDSSIEDCISTLQTDLKVRLKIRVDLLNLNNLNVDKYFGFGNYILMAHLRYLFNKSF